MWVDCYPSEDTNDSEGGEIMSLLDWGYSKEQIDAMFDKYEEKCEHGYFYYIKKGANMPCGCEPK